MINQYWASVRTEKFALRLSPSGAAVKIARGTSSTSSSKPHADIGMLCISGDLPVKCKIRIRVINPHSLDTCCARKGPKYKLSKVCLYSSWKSIHILTLTTLTLNTNRTKALIMAKQWWHYLQQLKISPTVSDHRKAQKSSRLHFGKDSKVVQYWFAYSTFKNIDIPWRSLSTACFLLYHSDDYCNRHCSNNIGCMARRPYQHCTSVDQYI